jgi:hypothetical protein
MARAVEGVEKRTRHMAYQAWLGFYLSSPYVKLSKEALVQTANHFSDLMGLRMPPALLPKTIGQVRLIT